MMTASDSTQKLDMPKEEKERWNIYLSIIQNHFPDFDKNDIDNMLADLSKHGCAITSISNILANKFYNGDSFKEQFGFDLKVNDSTDYNILLVDMCCSVYNKAKIDIYRYERFSFDSVFDAARELLNEEYDNEVDASNALYKKGITPDGFDENGKLQYRTTMPTKESSISSLEEIAMEEFGIDKKDISKEELTSLFKTSGSDINIEDLEFYQKFSGLTENNKTFWTNYYLNQKGLDYEVFFDMNQYDQKDFYQMIKDNLLEGNGIEIGSNHKDPVYLHTNKRFSYFSLDAGNGKGHAMTFKDIDDSGNIIVSSWGRDYIIDKEYIPDLEVSVVKIKEKEKTYSENKKA